MSSPSLVKLIARIVKTLTRLVKPNARFVKASTRLVRPLKRLNLDRNNVSNIRFTNRLRKMAAVSPESPLQARSEVL